MHSKIIFIFLICIPVLSIQTEGQTHLMEDFSAGEMPPAGWTIDNVSGQWTISASGNAGGMSPEGRFQWIQQINTTRLISSEINLSGLTTVFFQFNLMYDDYDGEGPAVGIATRSENGDWNSVWEILPEANTGPEKIELEISNEDVGKPDFQICCYIQGDLYNLDYWYVDDIWLYSPMELDVTIFLEGPFMIDIMANHLNISGDLPLFQPYTISPWHYAGTENVTAIPNANVTDWVLVELLKRDQAAQPEYSSVAKQAGFILQSGTVTGLDGSNPLSFHIQETDSLYVWIHHRNHLSVMSAGIVTQSEGVHRYDFTPDCNMAHFGKYAMKKLSADKWGIIAGDGNADGQVNNGDKYEVWLEQQGNSGYLSGDFNLDGQVNEADIDKFWEPNSGKAHWIPDTATIPFFCGDTILDSRDGQLYTTVQIGGQCWMQENLNYATGTSWCYYNDPYYCETYGRLYSWPTIMNGAPGSNLVPSGVSGICPENWHLPSDAEWCILTQYIDSTLNCDTSGYNGTDAATKMKATWGWSSGGNGTNASGFNSLPGGCMGIYHFDDLYLFSYFWSTTEDYPGYAWLIKLNYGLPTVGRYFSLKNRGYSVRCVKD